MIITGSKVRIDPTSSDIHGGMTGSVVSIHHDQGNVQACVKLTAWGTCVMTWLDDLIEHTVRTGAEDAQDRADATEGVAQVSGILASNLRDCGAPEEAA